MRPILLLGAQGQVGQELQPLLHTLGPVTAMSRSEVDLTQPDEIRAAIQDHHPQIVVNAAAYTAVDRAETEPDLARAINAIAPTIMAETVQTLGAQLIHLSTDYVFEGRKGSPYLETDETRPLGIYGETKRAGEQGVIQACDRHLILRTAWVYGAHGKHNFVKTMLRLGQERPALRVVADQIGSPTWARDIARAIATFISLEQTDRAAPSGVYHFTNSGVASWYDFAIAIFEEAQHLGLSLQVSQVHPIRTQDYPTSAQRPGYSVLSWAKTNQTLGCDAPHWRVSLRSMLQEFLPTLDLSPSN